MLAASCLLLTCKQQEKPASLVQWWLTTPDRSRLLEKQDGLSWTELHGGAELIEIDTATRYQTVEGFGFALTGGSAYLINEKLSELKKRALLENLFSPAGIGISYLRISVGSSDLDDHVFSYCDLPPGKADPELAAFSLAPDEENLIPVLNEILAINPSLRIMASPWSAPAWMKTNTNPKGGSLNPKYYESYARYFVRYLRGMQEHGVNITTLTIQNEPENPNNNPSMLMTSLEQAVFIKDFLGPALNQAGLSTQVIVFDHNADHPEYPIAILNDSAARKYVEGSAFHLYLGEVSALGKVHDAHPDKGIYFTEQWTSAEGQFGGDLAWHVTNLVVGATRNWARTVIEWNLAADPDNNPHTDGGCTLCLGALTIGPPDSVAYNVSYYIIGHGSKFVPPGSVRVFSTQSEAFPNVAFKTPLGNVVLILLNAGEGARVPAVKLGTLSVAPRIPSGGVATLVVEPADYLKQ